MNEQGAPGKNCTKCGEWKQLSAFTKDKSKATGYKSVCLQCGRLAAKEWRQNNREYVLEKDRRRRSENPEYFKEHYRKDPQKVNDRAKRWRSDNPEKAAASLEKWKRENPDRVREINRLSAAKRRETPQGRIDDAVSAAIRGSLKKGEKQGRSTFEILGYTRDALMAHLERQFLPGMTWENYGKIGWEIDHIIPRSAFNYQITDDIDFKRCWALENLRPLWGPDNWSKGDKLLAPFQPSLALAVVSPTATP